MLATKVLITTLFIVVEILVSFGILVWVNKIMGKYEIEFTEIWLMTSALITVILFIWIMISFILYIFS